MNDGLRPLPKTGGEKDFSAELAQRRVGHTEARTHVLGEQFDRILIRDRIGLRQVFHGFDQQALAIDVAGIGGMLTPSAGNLRRDGDRKNLGHEHHFEGSSLPAILPAGLV
jgi:hypothetical protein